MKRKVFNNTANRILLATVLVQLVSGLSLMAIPKIYPTGVTVYNPSKAYNSYVLFSSPDAKTHLIDMNGNEVHKWDYIGFPSELLDPKVTGGKKGHVMLQLENGIGGNSGIFNNKVVGEVDWNGNVVWQWGKEAPGGEARQNHDWNRLTNGNTLLVVTVDRTVSGVSEKPIADQTIYEVTSAGKIVWSWNAGDHIDEFGINSEGRELLRKVYVNGGKGHGFLTINDMQPIGSNKWFDGGDKRFDPDNIVIDSREASFIAIIEKKTGKIVWRIGGDYGKGTETNGVNANFATSPSLRPTLSNKVPRPIDQTSGQHDAHIIPKGLPGEGNLLVFDNEGPSGYPPTRISTQHGSRILEIDPIKKEIVWQYTALDSEQPVWDFFSSYISSARRLPNGNTLIDEGMNGRIFQVTADGEIVWEYVSPYFTKYQQDSKSVFTNWIFRAQPVPYNWVPEGTPHSEIAVEEIDITKFRIPTKSK